jgi:AbrB family looped-hinge helix DNA binding protein
MLHSTVTKKGQTTLPSRVRRALNMKPGDKLVYELEEKSVVVRVDPGTRSLMGSLPSDKGKGISFKTIRDRAAKAWKRGAGNEGSGR